MGSSSEAIAGGEALVEKGVEFDPFECGITVAQGSSSAVIAGGKTLALNCAIDYSPPGSFFLSPVAQREPGRLV